MSGWRSHCCDHGHRYQLHGEQPHQTIECPLCTACTGKVAKLPDGITGRIGNNGKPWRFLRATPQP